MLTKFSVKNYRGFTEKLEWDLSHPNSYTFNAFAIKNGIIKNGIVYGLNGCGKSSLSLALFDIVNHLTQKFKKLDYYVNFASAAFPDRLVEFEYVFQFDRQKVDYRYAKTRDGNLVKEQLFVDGHEVFNLDGETFFIDESVFPLQKTAKDELMANANHVSVVNYLLMFFPLPADNYLIRLRDFVTGMLWYRNVDTREFIGLENAPANLYEFIIGNELVEDFQKFLNDISGQTFDFVTPNKSDKSLMCRYGNATIPYEVIASTGTHALTLLFYWIRRMKQASFVFIDEFDAFYHFDLSYAVCKQLFDINCQVFLSSHNTYLMTNDLLRPDCNFILNHNRIKPLCDCTEKELRFAHNIEKIYRAKGFIV